MFYTDPFFWGMLGTTGLGITGWLFGWHWFTLHAELWLALKADATDRAKAEKVKQAQAQQQAKQAPAKPLEIHVGGHRIASLHMPAAIKVGE